MNCGLFITIGTVLQTCFPYAVAIKDPILFIYLNVKHTVRHE